MNICRCWFDSSCFDSSLCSCKLLPHTCCFAAMPNGRGRSADSPVHTSDSEDYFVLKARRRLLGKRVVRGLKNNVRVKKERRWLRKAAHNTTALRVALCKRLPVYVCFRVCLFLWGQSRLHQHHGRETVMKYRCHMKKTWCTCNIICSMTLTRSLSMCALCAYLCL